MTRAMRRPAIKWRDTLPTGSGAVGALVFGQIWNGLITLNHEARSAPKARAERPRSAP